MRVCGVVCVSGGGGTCVHSARASCVGGPTPKVPLLELSFKSAELYIYINGCMYIYSDEPDTRYVYIDIQRYLCAEHSRVVRRNIDARVAAARAVLQIRGAALAQRWGPWPQGFGHACQATK